MPINKKKKTFLPQQPVQPIRTFAPLPAGPQEGLASERAYGQSYAATLPQPVQPLQTEQPQQFAPPQQPERTFGGTLRDIGVTALKGAVALPQAAQGLIDIPTGGHFGKLTERLGYKPEETQRILAGQLSPAQQYAEQQVSEAKGFVPTLKAALQHPSTIARAAAESAPLMVAGGAAGRGITALAPRIAPVIAGAMGEGLVSAGLVAEDIRSQTDNKLLSPAQSAAALAAGIGTGIFSAAGGRVAGKLGIADIDTLLAGSSLKKPSNVAKAIVYGGVSEGLFEEMPQEMQEQVWKNAATGKDLMDGVPESAAQAVLTGGLMGAGANVAGGLAQQPQLPPSGPTQRAAEGAQPIQPDQPPGVTIEPEGFSAQLQADTVDAFDQARFAVQQGQIQPGTEEFQAVKESIEEIQQRNIPEEQAALKQNKDVVDFFTQPQQAPPSTAESAIQRGVQAAGAEPVLDETLAGTAAAPVTKEALGSKKDVIGQELTDQEKVKKWTTEEVDRINKISPEKRTPEQKEFVRDLSKTTMPTEAEPVTTTEAETPATAKIKEQAESKEEWVEFGKETETLNIPRAEMPQVKSEDRGALANYLRSRGVEYAKTTVLPTELKPTQKEFSPEKIQKAREYTGTERAILVSDDGHVIDGHHQWVKGLTDSPGREIPVIRLGGKVEEILGLVKGFPSSRTSAELAEKAPVREKELGTRVLKEGLSVEGERTYLKDFTPKEFQEEFRNPKEMPRLTDSSEYKKILPKNTEKIVSEAATIKQNLNNAKASVKESKQHLVKLFDKEGQAEIEVQFEGRPYTIKKPEVGAEVIILNQKGDDATEALKAKFKAEGQMEYDPKPGKRSLSIQPVKVGKSHASQYGPKTLLQAATEHVKLSSEQYQYSIEEKVIKAEMLAELVDNLKDKGVGHTWRNEAGDTSFSVKRAPAAKVFASKEAKAEYGKKYKELKEKPEFVKKVKPGELKTAGVTPAQAGGIKGKGSRAKAAELKARVQAEIAERVKLSKAAGVLPKAEQANILDELNESLGQLVVQKLQQGKAFELVSNEQALSAVKKDAEAEAKYSKDGQRIEGLTFPDGKVWLVKENIAKGQALTVLTHELGVHARKLGFNDGKVFKRILKQLESRLGTGADSDINAAFAKVPDSTPAEQVTEEGLARLASMSPEHGLIRKLFAAIKQFLINKGFFPKYFTSRLTTADLQMLAQSAIKADTKPRKQKTDTKVKFSLADLPKTPEAIQQRLNNTENLNATAPGGTTSGATPEQGKSYMARVSKAVGEAVSKVTAEKQAEIKKEREFIGAYHALRNVSRSPVASMKKKQETLEAFQGLVPEEVQGDLTQALGIISNPKAGFERQKRAFEKVKDTLLEATKADLDKTIRSSQLPRIKPELRQGKRGKNLKTDMGLIRKAKQMDRGAILDQQEALDKKIDRSKEIIGSPQSSKEGIAQAEENLADYYSEKQLLTVFGDFGKLSYAEILRAKEAVNDLVTNGTGAWRVIQDQRNALNNKNALMVRQEVQGKQDPKDYSRAEMSQVAEKEKTVTGRAKKLVTDVENSNMILGFYLNKIAGKSGKGMLQSDTVKLFEGIAAWGTRREEQLKLSIVENTIKTKAAEVFGSGKKLMAAMARMAEVSTDKVYSYSQTGQKKEPFHIGPGQAIYLRQLSNFDEAQSGLDAMGVTEETLKDIENYLSPEEKQWGDWQQQEFYPKLQADTGKVIQNVEGISILNNPNEVPLHRETGGLDIGVQRTRQAGLKHGTSSEIEKEDQPFRLMDADQVMMDHMKGMTHYQAWAGPMGIITGTFNDPQVQSSIIAEYGKNTMDGLKLFFRDMAEVPGGTTFAWADKARANVTTALLGGSLITPVKQLASIPAMSADIPSAAFAKNFTYGVAHPREVREFVKNWDFIDRRMKLGFERDMKIAKTKQTKAVIAGSKNIADWMMLPIGIGDAAGVIGGSFPVFKYYKDQGKTPEEAYFLTEKTARRTQQDSAIYNQTNFQRGGSWNKLFTMFLSSNILYTNQLQASFRALLTDPKKNYRSASKRIALFGVILPGIFTVIGAGGLGAWHGDDEDDERLKETLLRDIVLAGPKGMPLIGQTAEGLWNTMKGYHYGKNPTYSPVTEIGKSLSELVEDGKRYIVEDQDGEALLALADSAATLLSYGTGVGYKPVKRTLEGWYDASTGQTKHPVLAVWGMSRYARGEK